MLCPTGVYVNDDSTHPQMSANIPKIPATLTTFIFKGLDVTFFKMTFICV